MTEKLGKIFVAVENQVCVIKLVGDIRVILCSSIDKYIEKIFTSKFPYKNIIIDLMETEAIDSTSLGLLAKMSLHAQQRFSIKPTIFTTNPSITKLLNSVGFAQIFNIETGFDSHIEAIKCKELKAPESSNETKVREKVIEAHKILMGLNNENREAFKELVSTLENNN
jgi:anti-anti-sigma factor